MDFDLPEDSKARRKERPKRANKPEGLKQAERCREPGEEQCFGQELAQQASAAGSERAPERHFRLTLDRLGHEELRGVDACDEGYSPTAPDSMRTTGRVPRVTESCRSSTSIAKRVLPPATEERYSCGYCCTSVPASAESSDETDVTGTPGLIRAIANTRRTLVNCSALDV